MEVGINIVYPNEEMNKQCKLFLFHHRISETKAF